jgi:hypothetical protein
LVISAVPLAFATPPAETSLDKQVQAVANRVTEIIMAGMEAAPASRANDHATSNSIRQVQSIQKESSKCQNQKS